MTAPELTDEEIKELRPASEWFAEHGIPMPKPIGRPKAEQDQGLGDDADGRRRRRLLQGSGPGWQTRMHAVLAKEARKKSA